jgi:hypothetical protein
MGCPVRAESDSLMSAVGFALTGTKEVQPKLIGSIGNCVFAIGNELFRLNNIYTEQIKIQGWRDQRFGKVEEGVTVELHGSEIILEITLSRQKMMARS